ncbi:hypothetical protein [Paraburkholderia kirstenboschensis]|uniref:Uncharacterized protein n=1 Tax=Paraburkholderia kirstenboschensis TaxID=1245436 RepID=A0ABZ0ERM8_9BURK|nr:hypothetical protein [Paraburkholderia kirstenboschensis]WOD19810.1 hypothetical protein RW095_26740 [Paraburkholderia kirstenboschensis]
METILQMWLAVLVVLAMVAFVTFRINWRGAKYDAQFDRGLPGNDEHECDAHYPRSWE